MITDLPHTHTPPFNGPFPGLPRWAGTRKVKPIWILLKQETVSGSGITRAVCKSAPRSRQITMPAPHYSVFLQAGCPICRPTNSVKALKVVLTYQQSVFKRYHSDKHFSEFLPTTWRQKSTGIDMEHNYVTDTLCILFLALHTRHGQALTLESELVKSVEITSNGHSCWWDANTNQPGTSDKALQLQRTVHVIHAKSKVKTWIRNTGTWFQQERQHYNNDNYNNNTLWSEKEQTYFVCNFIKCQQILKQFSRHTHTRLTALFRDYPGEPVPER